MNQKNVAGLVMEAVSVNSIRPNTYNPNRMNAITFEKEKRSIQEHGFIDPITVRQVGDEDELEIIDGEHRWRAAKELGIETIPVANLGRIDDQKARKLTILYNELKGAPEPVLLAQVLKDLTEFETPEALAEVLPMTMAEIDTLVKSASSFDWENEVATADAEAKAKDAKAHEVKVVEKKVQIGTISGVISSALNTKLQEAFKASATLLKTNNVERVMEDWLDRLSRAETVVPVYAAVTEKPAQAKSTKGTKAPKKAKGTDGESTPSD